MFSSGRIAKPISAEFEEQMNAVSRLWSQVGMIRVFATISSAGLGSPEVLSTGISEAMITTAAGLIIGIPALVAYNWLNGRADRIIFDLEYNSTKVLDTLRQRQQRNGVSQ